MGHEVKSLRDLCIDLDPEETGTTFAENARIKAEAFCKASGLPTVADDSGLCVDALHGAPGVYSARYAGHHGDDAANNAKLLHEMADVPAGQRAINLSRPSALCCDGRALEVAGECPGSISFAETGSNGAGYDPLFVPARVGPARRHHHREHRLPQLCRTDRRREGRYQPPRPRHGKIGLGASGVFKMNVCVFTVTYL